MKTKYLFLILFILSIISVFIGVKELSLLDIYHLNWDEMEDPFFK